MNSCGFDRTRGPWPDRANIQFLQCRQILTSICSQSLKEKLNAVCACEHQPIVILEFLNRCVELSPTFGWCDFDHRAVKHLCTNCLEFCSHLARLRLGPGD